MFEELTTPLRQHPIPIYHHQKRLRSSKLLDLLLVEDIFDIDGPVSTVEDYMSPSRIQAETEPLFYFAHSSEQGYLGCVIENDEEGLVLLGFTSPARVKQYVFCEFGNDVPFTIHYASKRSWDWAVRTWLPPMGYKLVDIDRYCSSELTGGTPLDNFLTGDAREYWAIRKSCVQMVYEGLIGLGQKEFDAGHVKFAREIALVTAVFVEWEKPEVHVLVGKCAMAMDDSQLLAEARRSLMPFEGEWIAQLA